MSRAGSVRKSGLSVTLCNMACTVAEILMGGDHSSYSHHALACTYFPPRAVGVLGPSGPISSEK